MSKQTKIESEFCITITVESDTIPTWASDAKNAISHLVDVTNLSNVSLSRAGDRTVVLTAEMSDRTGVVAIFTK